MLSATHILALFLALAVAMLPLASAAAEPETENGVASGAASVVTLALGTLFAIAAGRYN